MAASMWAACQHTEDLTGMTIPDQAVCPCAVCVLTRTNIQLIQTG